MGKAVASKLKTDYLIIRHCVQNIANPEVRCDSSRATFQIILGNVFTPLGKMITFGDVCPDGSVGKCAFFVVSLSTMAMSEGALSSH